MEIKNNGSKAISIGELKSHFAFKIMILVVQYFDPFGC